jgi:hypothetical protein
MLKDHTWELAPSLDGFGKALKLDLEMKAKTSQP